MDVTETVSIIGTGVVVAFTTWRIAVHYSGKNTKAREELRRAIDDNGKAIAKLEGTVDTVIELLKLRGRE